MVWQPRTRLQSRFLNLSHIILARQTRPLYIKAIVMHHNIPHHSLGQHSTSINLTPIMLSNHFLFLFFITALTVAAAANGLPRKLRSFEFHMVPQATATPTGATGSGHGPNWDYNWGWGSAPGAGWGYGSGSGRSPSGFGRGYGYGYGSGYGSGYGGSHGGAYGNRFPWSSWMGTNNHGKLCHPSMALQPQKAAPHFGCSDCREKRKKVDVKCVGSEGESESKFDLRKSLAWDSAFFTSPGVLEPEELFQGTWDNQKKWSSSSEMRSHNEFNSRSSLAWDNAFLTSEGVLDPVELSLVNRGFNKSEMHLLSAIQELRISSLSTHTDGSSSSLTSLELQLFEHPNHSHMPHIHSLKTMDGPTQPKMKSLPNPRKQTAHLSRKISKEPSTGPSSKQSSDGSEFNPPSSSSLKPPKSSGRVKSNATAPTKRVTNEVKQDSKQVQVTNGKSWIAAGKTRSPLKASASQSECHNFSYLVPKPTASRTEHRVGPKGTCSAHGSNSVAFLSSRNLKPSAIRVPSPKIGYFDEGEAGRDENENRSKAVKDKENMKSSKDYCVHHKMKAELCVRGKRLFSHKVDKALPHHRQPITAVGDSGDVLMELSTNQS
ncbi:hypothetical protein K1719_025098 [Acacia pycnantha]|nr:hypothetical protein K1719_025098 [Acacia pycnantha]